jgi:hypothetical protein
MRFRQLPWRRVAEFVALWNNSPKTREESGEEMGWIVRAPRDFCAGAVFVSTGVAALVVGRGYRLGTLLSMGPGYFPRIVGALLAVLGMAVLLASLRSDGASLAAWRVRPLVLLLASIVLFGWSLERFGLVAASVLLVVVACLADRDRKAYETIGVAVALTLIAWLVFVKGLEMPMQVWPGSGGS